MEVEDGVGTRKGVPKQLEANLGFASSTVEERGVKLMGVLVALRDR